MPQALPQAVSTSYESLNGFAYEQVNLTQEDLINVAWVYYYFSTVPRES